MATTMNPIALYHDSALNDPVLQSGNSNRNGSTNQGNIEQDQNSAPEGVGTRTAGQPQQDLDGPLWPPISYRGVGANADPRIHRSFSQRAKGRPFADEAFADDNSQDSSPSRPQRTNGRSVSANYPGPSAPQPTPMTSGVRPIQATEWPAQQSQRSSNVPSQSRPTVITGNETYGGMSPTSVSRSNTRRDAANQTEDERRNWASDRSPLQKLEVKLTDISKEEKRARVQEAEMRLRESRASQGSKRSQIRANQPSRSVSQPIKTDSSRRQQAQKPIINQGNQTASPHPGAGESTISRGTERTAPRQGPPIDIPLRQYNSVNQRVTMPAPKQYPGVQKPLDSQSPLPREAPQPIPERQSTGNGPRTEALPSQIPRPVIQHQRPLQGVPRGTDRPYSDIERNASHQAALQQLTGGAPRFSTSQASASVPRKARPTSQTTVNNTRFIAQGDSPVPVDLGTLAGGGDQRFEYAASKGRQHGRTQIPQPQQTQPVVGLGVQSLPPAQPSSSHALDKLEASKGRQRKSSVSFKEPFDKRRPVDEWKAGDIARLTAEDYLTEQPKSPDTYKAWWEQDQAKKAGRSRASGSYGAPAAQIDDHTASYSPRLYIKCGPLLRYVGLRRTRAESGSSATTKEFWRGTIMIVTQDSKCSYDELPTLRLFAQPKKLLPPPPALVTGDQLAPEYIDPIAGLTKVSRTGHALYVRPVDHLEEARDLSRLEDDNGIYEASPSPLDGNGKRSATTAATNRRTLDTDGERLGRYKEVRGVRIYADPDRDVTFWRFNIEVELGPEQQHIAYRINKGAAVGFWVPARGKTMNIMFHSCNGFSMAVDANTFSGPDPLWRDVLNNHQTRPFHVMIGGGDQIYNDRVMVDTHLFGDWTQLKNPHSKHHALFTPEMKNELEDFYLERYSMWFSQGLFGMANASIPMVNVWDDHDIIDGFGSYPDDFMRSPVFTGLGDIAHKYYLLFQHQTVDTMTEKEEPSWVLGKKPGPYIQHLSRSIYMELGQSVAFLGLDARTERTRHDVLSIDTLEIILERCRRDMVEGQTKHLIVLLGVPIAYPRLVWLENILTSKALDPIKALHRAGIVKTKLLNRFDGGVEILDDLDDHWTASHHKDERNILIQDLQDLAAEKSARVTILSGDVHLAAIGQFYSNPKLKVPKDRDHRYMPNIISSAIVNTPPPDMLADVLNKRNRVHHLDKYTDEDMIPMFTHDVDERKRNNTRLLPRRNWCSIREYLPGDTPPPSPSLSPSIGEDDASFHSETEGQYDDQQLQNPKRRLSLPKAGFNPRNLMRRLSSRGAPPNSYKQNTDSGQFQQRTASLDSVNQGQLPHAQPQKLRASSMDNMPDVPALRPTFHRRPTNLSEKAARKGIVPAVDAEGKEVHFNDHVNLEGGLDIVINCEVNQKDPAGITTPYRLLVPALIYDGSSDREKLNTATQPNRGGTLLQKFGLNARRGNRPADSQGAGNWGQEMSDTESYTESEEHYDEKPKSRFSLFGSKNKKQPQQFAKEDIQHPHLVPEQIQRNEHELPVNNDPGSSDSYGARTRTRSLDQANDQDFQHAVIPEPRMSRKSYQQVQQPMRQSLPPSISQRSSQRSSRPLSYTIGGTGGPPPLRSEYSSTQADGRPPYDPDAAYVSSHNQGPAASTQRSSSSGQGNPMRSISTTRSPEDDLARPQPSVLRGNGIIGKNIPPSSYRNSSSGNDFGGQHQQTQEQQDQPKGYSGIEAYKEPKPRRRWSLRERARNIRDSFDARRRTSEDEWYSDEEEEQYWEGRQRG